MNNAFICNFINLLTIQTKTICKLNRNKDILGMIKTHSFNSFMPLPSTKSLQVFLATAKHLNFTRAADAMNLTQGAISRQVIALEETVGVPLFYRHARGLSLTEQGRLLVPKAQDILDRLQQAISDVSASSSRIKLNAPSCVTSWLLPRLMAFQDAHPDVDVELTSSINHHSAPNFEAFDVVIIYGKEPKQPSVTSHHLFEERLTPMCRPELWDAIVPKAISDPSPWLEQFTWLHANSTQSDWQLWLNHRQQKKMSSKSNQHFSTLDQAMNAAQQGFGIAIGDVTLAQQDLSMNRLIQPFNDTVLSGQSYYFLYPRQTHNPILNLLQNWLISTH